MFGSLVEGDDIYTIRRILLMKIAVFYYSQTGQALKAAHCIFSSISSNGIDSIIYKAIEPIQYYPFPWSSYEFFDTFPETRMGFPPSGIKEIDFSDVKDADVVAIVGQSWFLSPSLPLQSFFADSQVCNYLYGRDVIFVNVCRNMWLMTIRWLKNYFQEIGAQLIGHIVLQDKEPNLVSAATVIRWLMYGKKESEGYLPNAGISEKDLKEAKRFGIVIKDAIDKGEQKLLQERLLNIGAINYKPSIMHIEQIGHRIFGYWANYIRKKGGFRDECRATRVKMFYYYLVFVLFLVSPIVQLFFYATYPFQKVKKKKISDCSVYNNVIN